VSAQSCRLPSGGRIDREQPITFRFDDRQYTGCAGDTLASALLANGVHLVGRSFKYHRPRGILSCGAEEPNALVQLGTGARTQPNMRATQIELYAGLEAFSQNRWPSLRLDVGEVNNLLSRVLPAGFYYKTFMWPKRAWMGYEHFIRRAAGLGRAPEHPDPDTYDKMHAHCDVLVAGGGPAGLAAALAAARAGARVILADEQAEFGGALLGRNDRIDDKPAMEWVETTVQELAGCDDARLLSRTSVAGYYDHNYLTLVERVTDHLPPGEAAERPRQRLWKVRAAQVVLATGAHERPLVFSDNDRPGVMLASAAQAYVNRYAVRPGDRAMVVTNNDSAYGVACDLSDAGIQVTMVDTRREPSDTRRAQLRKRGVEVLAGHGVMSTAGRERVSAVEVAALNAAGDAFSGAARTLRCDLVCMSGGWNPAVHLFSQSRGRLTYDTQKACFVPGESFQAERSAGSASGAFELAYVISEGREAGKVAASEAGYRKRGSTVSPRVELEEETPIEPQWVMPRRARGAPFAKHFVDFQNDVTAADIGLAAREGYRSVEHLKRYTTTGMGTDQGKTANVNAIAILARQLGVDMSSVGTTTFRPPYTPVTIGALAGRDIGDLADPVRMTPIHAWHVEHGAKFEDVGQWKRPWYYPRPGETMHDAVNRECMATRNAIGILDASTLGKIDIQGPDAAELLDRIYTNDWKSLALGHCRYGLMCGEDGMLFDDGVTTRLGEQHYLMTTTSGNAARVLSWLEEWLQTEWPELRVFCNSVTEQWCTVGIAGPLARALLGELTDDIDLSTDAFPFMTCRAGNVAGIPARVMRVSFTGELSYEINVASNYGMYLWSTLMAAGQQYGITPFGTETMHVLRAEKGFIIAGQDSDGTVTPADLGMSWAVSKTKDVIGKRSMSRPDSVRSDRKQLVGLLTDAPGEVLPEGAQIVDELQSAPPMKMIGHVTSSYYSANLGHSIALALVKGGRQRRGERVHIPLDERTISATITAPRFFDPKGERMNA
jgi:sarcosine oxidase subunit alpha